MSAFIDLTGQRFGTWTVTARIENDNGGSARWLCQCENCGKKIEKVGKIIRYKKTQTCTCLRHEKMEATAAAKTTPLSPAEIHSFFSYDPSSGTLKWARGPGGKARKGNVAGCLKKDGYLAVVLHGKQYPVHRLAYLCMTGVFPPEEIDHKNLNKTDNRWINLRAATRSQNAKNMKYKGFSKVKSRPGWISTIRNNGRKIYLGYFRTQEEAATAYKVAAKRYHGEFARIE